MPSIVVDEHGTELSYIDSGAPSGAKDYVTIFAVHGSAFTGAIWDRTIALAPNAGVRFVAINRRGYPGSTPLSPEEINVLSTGTDEQKAESLKTRGVELATFIDTFAENNSLPSISADGLSGGFAIVGWSLGASFSLAAIAAVGSLPPGVQARWKAGMRAFIMHEAPTIALGKPVIPGAWTPLVDQSMPEDGRATFFSQWITSYFKHGDLLSRDLKAISFLLPATSRPPTIYTMSETEIARAVYEPPLFGYEMAFMVFSATQIEETYHKAVFDKDVRALVPKMKVTAFCGDASASFAIPSQWAFEDDDKAAGGGFITVKWVSGFNHVSQVADPAATLQVYKDAF